MERLSKEISKALQLAYDVHQGQVDKAGKPYILHPVTVAMTLAMQGYSEDCIVAALLHDVVEDTDVTLEDLQRMQFSDNVIRALALLTHNDGTEYMEYVKKVKGNPVAAAVKMADLLHNSDRSRLKTVTPKDEERLLKYEHAISLL